MGEGNIQRYILNQFRDGNIDKSTAFEYLKELQQLSKSIETEVAIVGIAGKFPGADNKDIYWSNLVNKKKSIASFPQTRKRDIESFLPEGISLPNGGFLSEVDKFDASFFRISPNEAVAMDPSQRLFLETAYEAVEDAGYGGSCLSYTDTGVYVGVDHTYKSDYSKALPDGDIHSLIGSYSSILASRVSYFLNLLGPSVVIDTACSSGLVALQSACRALINNDCKMAIVGGVSLFLLPQFSEMSGLVSPDYEIRAFDSKANGTVWGEGIAAIVIKPLRAAINDKDYIYAVIKGSSVNNNGTTSGITALSAEAQSRLVLKACQQANINPGVVSYIESHGSGNLLSDAIEIQALSKAYSKATGEKQYCSLGALKPNIGNSVAVSGLASIIKVAMSLDKRQIPPVINFDEPNPHIDMSESPFYISNNLTEWNNGGETRYAAVNSYGFSGTNCHIILEQAPDNQPVLPANTVDESFLFTLSAKTLVSLAKLLESYIEFLNQNKNLHIANICYTANTGRGHYHYRVAAIVTGKEDLVDKLTFILMNIQNINAGNLDIKMQDDLYYGFNKNLKGSKAVSVDNPHVHKDATAYRTFLRQLAVKYSNGSAIDWDTVYQEKMQKVNLPVYQFDRERYWVPILEQKFTVKTTKPIQEKTDISLSGREHGLYNETEIELANIWAEVLGVKHLSINDSFLELGGNSLNAMMMIQRIHEKFLFEINVLAIFQYETLQDLAAYIGLNLNAHNTQIIQTIDKAEYRSYYPTSSSQKRLYMLHQMDNTGIEHNLSSAFIIKGRLDLARFEEACLTVIERHEPLRTIFDFVDGEIVQKIVDAQLANVCEDINEKELADTIKGWICPFDLSKAPLIRIKIGRMNEEKSLLFIDAHHIIFDGTSLSIFINECLHLYNAQNLPDLTVTYKDYSVWHNSQTNSEAFMRQKDYWLNVYEDVPPMLSLPVDFPRLPFQDNVGEVFSFHFNEELTQKLQKIAIEQKTTMFVVFLAILNVFISKTCGQDDILIGTPVSGRTSRDMQSMIGLFINTIVLRNKPNRKKKFIDFLAEVKADTFASIENQLYPFDELVSQKVKDRDMSRNPLFDIMLVYQNFMMPAMQTEDFEIIPYEFNQVSVPCDLTFEVIEWDHQLLVNLKYRTQLYKKETIERLSKYFNHLVMNVISDLNKPIGEIPLIAPDERDRILADFSNSNTVMPIKERTIHSLIDEQCLKSECDTAVIFGDKHLSYGDLKKRSDHLSSLLRKKGVDIGTVVGLMVDRSVEMLISMIAILKSGGLYLPLDTEYPQERLNYMISDSQVKVLITTKAVHAKKSFDGTVVYLEDLDFQGADGEELEDKVEPDDLAYMMYTSGSTGKPKGVMIEHQAVHNFIASMTNRISFKRETRVLAVTTTSFDISVLELLLPLTAGSVVVLADDKEVKDPELLIEVIKKNQIEILQSTPSRMKQLLYCDPNLLVNSSLKSILIGGEILPYALASQLLNHNARIYNMYGPTESTIWSSIKEITELDAVTIGRPLDNTRMYILDEDLNVQPTGVAGELYIAGAGLARGYWNQFQLTQTRFVPDIVCGEERMYRTGDLAKWLPDREIEYIGRMDNQMKIRGYRIEPGEIVENMSAINKIEDAYITKQQYQDGTSYLCGYYLADITISDTEWREFLSKRLPDFMIPSYFFRLKQAPLTPNGKLDLQTLSLVGEIPNQVEFHAPKNEIESGLTAIWSDLLNRDKGSISVLDSFFNAGGNSLLLLKLKNEIDKWYPGVFAVADLFANPTIEKMSAFIQLKQEQLQAAPLIPISWPKEYILDEYAIGDNSLGIDLNIKGQIKTGLEKAAVKMGVFEEDIILAVIIYVLDKLSHNENKITIQVMDAPKHIKSLFFDLSLIESLSQLIRRISQIKSLKEAIPLSKISDVMKNKEPGYIFPIFYDKKLLNNRVNLLDEFDLILGFDKSFKDNSWQLQINSNKVGRDSLAEIAKECAGILDYIVNKGGIIQ
ncbi:non-ribosomal peptide synthetase [Paenibacillus tengchongensis]|uniref:non-ribosomal peptide synthetase n=1 Tax=Paenibacillus tengchongensis TaxID=2608684 RepID=UPI00124DE1C3|nr:non-ribosomal peptide synthetase [Paenibacillus tengchongensis]